MLVKEHYTEERVIQIKGRFGWDAIENFMGAQLRSHMDVRVYPQSIEPLTREAVEARLTNWAQLGWIEPQAAMHGINTGMADDLIASVEDDIAWANRILRRARMGPEALFSMPGRMEQDPITGQMMQVPGWMPRPFHNVPVLMNVFETYMKTQDYERLAPPMQEAVNQVYDACIQLKAKKEAEDAAAQAHRRWTLVSRTPPGRRGRSRCPTRSPLPRAWVPPPLTSPRTNLALRPQEEVASEQVRRHDGQAA